MSKINYKYTIIYIVLVLYLIVSKTFFIPYFNKDYIEFINPLFWTIFMGFSYFLKRNEEERIKSKLEKLQKLIIITIIYYLIYFSIGLVIGYGYTIYNKSLVGMVKNIISYIIPAICQSYVVCKLVFESYKNYLLNIIIVILFILFNVDIFAIKNMETGTEIFKFLMSDVFIVILRTITLVYLAYIASYKACFLYVIPYMIMNIIVPIMPNYDWFTIMLSQFILSTIIYIVLHKVEQKAESNDDVRLYKKCNKVFNYIFLTIFFTIIFFVAGLFSYKPIGIMSNSMLPKIHRGDAVVIEKIKHYGLKNVKVGDVIAFDNKEKIVVHRIIKIDKTEYGDITYITQGDNNNARDPEIKGDQIIGVVKFKIWLVAYPSVWLNELLR